MKKTILSLFAFVLFGIGLFTNTVRAEFKDVSENHPYHEAIQYLQSNNVVEGYPDGSFKPDVTINRAEFVKIMIETDAALQGIKQCIFQPEMPDVPNDAWFARYICIAMTNGIVAGYPDKTFRPGNNINFVEASKIIANTYDLNTEQDTAIWYKPFVDAIAEKKAVPASIHSFDQSITRGEMAEMIFGLISGEPRSQITYISLSEQIDSLPSSEDDALIPKLANQYLFTSTDLELAGFSPSNFSNVEASQPDSNGITVSSYNQLSEADLVKIFHVNDPSASEIYNQVVTMYTNLFQANELESDQYGDKSILLGSTGKDGLKIRFLEILSGDHRIGFQYTLDDEQKILNLINVALEKIGTNSPEYGEATSIEPDEIYYNGTIYRQGETYPHETNDCLFYMYKLNDPPEHGTVSCRAQCNHANEKYSANKSLNKVDSNGSSYIYAHQCTCNRCE